MLVAAAWAFSVSSNNDGWSLVEILKLNFGRGPEAEDFEAEVWSRF